MYVRSDGQRLFDRLVAGGGFHMLENENTHGG
jgi:hypothetical protein